MDNSWTPTKRPSIAAQGWGAYCMVIDQLLHWQDLLVTTYCTDKAWHDIPETRYHSALPKASLLSHQMVPTLPSGHFEFKMIVLNVKNWKFILLAILMFYISVFRQLVYSAACKSPDSMTSPVVVWVQKQPLQISNGFFAFAWIVFSQNGLSTKAFKHLQLFLPWHFLWGCVFSTSLMNLKLSSEHHLVSFPPHLLFLSEAKNLVKASPWSAPNPFWGGWKLLASTSSLAFTFSSSKTSLCTV